MTMNQIANVSISRERVEKILHSELGMMKFSAQLVLCLQTSERKRVRLITSLENLTVFEGYPFDFFGVFLAQ